ncbi:hypothetical protein BAUCODRAFT_530646 [Baudoinia panamericana UAMH 10762]|uniref:Carboxylic ester hydrolase n=1 Tax=Baudoinia panamericana (strain UAMH 10762) TaxID=717646 RepID=M2N7Y7_BAUPA|nr:uncharacterized protein BAUCODRAFT_530646 [Baudoinia panamericana UAMH 10762]EMC95199.1 hypothetical protein BAUCODRAFT_530646 [Baudoinia panamericana UAMH 10762]
MLPFCIFSFFTVALTAPVAERAAAPSVTIQNGTVVGSTSSGIDNFKGVPFAQPPTGTLRLKPPQTIAVPYETITATGTPTACPQFYFQANTTDIPDGVVGTLLDSPGVQAATVSGEDCLTLNVQRPSGTAANAGLPVVFWIYGGGFEFGSTQSYDATNLIQRSVSLGKPIVYVAVNYRLGGFGFLAGSDLASEGSTNLGLRDQRLGLEWVAENIAAFGGDPTKVTIWGESAGAISVFDQTIINGGDNTYKGKALFRGAIMDSGSVTPADPVTAPQAQAVYNSVVQAAGCSGSSERLACLRALPYEQYLAAANSVPAIFGYRAVDLAYLPRPDPGNSFLSLSPDIALNNGAYAKVPIINGDQQDEGTLFSLTQANITNNAELITYLASYFPSNPNAVSDVTQLVSYYPDKPLLGQPDGSPFNTGSLNNIYPEYKRLAAILGDITFTLTRRTYLSVVSTQVKAWSYLSTYLYGTPVLGTFHASDILIAYGDATDVPIPTQAVQQYYISFINSLDPNALGTPAPLITWPQWTTASPQLVNFAAAALSLTPDTFRNAAAQFLATHTASFRV